MSYGNSQRICVDESQPGPFQKIGPEFLRNSRYTHTKFEMRGPKDEWSF